MNMNPLVLDFETYFDKDITLKKLNYSEYVPQAQPLCVSWLVNNQIHFAAGNDIITALAQIPWDTVELVGHNLLFDAFVLKHWYGHKAKSYCDTLGLARHRHPSLKHDLGSLAQRFCPQIPKLTENLKPIQGKTWDTLSPEEQRNLEKYNKNDVLITSILYDKLSVRTSKTELALIDHTIKLWLNPVIILDQEKAHAAIIEERHRINQQLTNLEISRENIRSDRMFSAILQAKGYKPPTKWSDKQQKLIPAFAKTDSAFLDFYAHNPELRDLLDLKRAINSNIKESRTERLINTAKLNNGKVPVAYNYHGAFTGRASGSNRTNLQNLPRGGILRDSLVAPDGFQFVVADLAQIEARVLAWLAEETQILNAFRNKRDLYSEVASKIYDKPINKKDHPVERQIGKCLGPDTKVLTQRGWHPITKVLTTDLLWDGVSWVQHSGLRFQGNQSTLTSHGITATSSHLLLTEDGWQTWEDALINPSLFQSALNLANLPSSNGSPAAQTKAAPMAGTPSSNAPVAGKDTWTAIISKWDALLAATLVRKSKQILNAIGCTNRLWMMINPELVYSTVYPRASPAATTKPVNISYPTADAASPYTTNGGAIAQHSYNTYKHWKVGITQIYKWIESITTRATSLVTFDSCQPKPTTLTADKSTNSHNASYTWNKNSPTYDLLSAGPRNRFTILSNRGPVIVHNSAALGLGYGMGAEKFNAYCALQGQILTTEFTTKVVETYRTTYNKLPVFWNLLQHSIYLLSLNERHPVTITRNLVINNDYIILPSNRPLKYEGVHWDRNMWRLIDGKRIYGPLICENLCQAIARDILVDQILTIDPHWPIIMHTHDELIALVPNDQVEKATQFIHRTMTTPPVWARDLPLDVEIHNGHRYGDCK